MALITNNTANKLKCDSSATVKTLVFNASDLEIILGAKTLFELSLSSFFQVVNKYLYQEFTIQAGQSIDLDPGNMGSSIGEVKFIAMLVEYPSSDNTQASVGTAEQYLLWEYPLGGQQMTIGKIMILSGSSTQGLGWDLINSPGGLRITNPHTGFDVGLKVLLVN